MATQHAVDETDIRQLIDRLVEGIRAMDLERLKTCFAPDMVSFDIGPPLQHVGSEAKLNNWRVAFTMFQPPLDYEVRDLASTVGGDIAFEQLSNVVDGPW